ncbi:MAG: dienelactone hydrolase family protein [Candidatus Schekmanbacteria bacterium]|nr:dienelactone hydrolase family protein [Candidatus Schekmanbacteria bacterium]
MTIWRVALSAFAIATYLALPALVRADEAATDAYVEAMMKEHATDSPVAGASRSAADDLHADSGFAIAEEKAITFGDAKGGAQVSGYLVWPAGAPVRSGIIVIHEWWGLNDHIRVMARALAQHGYGALAVDLYGGKTATAPEEAKSLMAAAMADESKTLARLQAAAELLREQRGVERLGVIGWCFGGGWALRTGLSLGSQASAVVMYYGRLVDDEATLAGMQAPLLGVFAEQDGGIPVAAVRRFEAALGKLGKTAEIKVYPGVDHAFANPSGNRFNAPAATDAWERTLAFFARHLAPKTPPS